MKLKILSLLVFLFFILKRYEFFVKFNPKKWINYLFNNCYGYALDDPYFCEKNDKGKCKQRKIVVVKKKGEKLNCENLLKGIKKEQMYIKKSDKETPCNEKYYKIFFLVNDKGNAFHFLRQDENGLWSHKQPNVKITQKDSDGKDIIDPEKANFDYGYVNYNKKCCYLCVPENYYISTRPSKTKANRYRNIVR